MKRFITFVVLTLTSSMAFGQRYHYVQPNCGRCITQQSTFTSQVVYNTNQPAYYSQPTYTQPTTCYSQPIRFSQPVVYSQPQIITPVQPVTTAIPSSSIPIVAASSTTSVPITTASYSTPVYSTPTYARPVTNYSAATYTTSYSNYGTSYSSGSGLAQQKAQIAASRGMRGRHVGGGFGGGMYEGVGFSTSSPQAAIQSACYWGQRPVHQVGVARGADGWYATVLYR